MDNLNSSLEKITEVNRKKEDWKYHQYPQETIDNRANYLRAPILSEQAEKGLGNTESFETREKSLSYEEEKIRTKMANTTFEQRSAYYFQDSGYLEAKVSRYRALEKDNDKDVSKFTEIYTNRSTRKRKRAAGKAADHFEKAAKLENKLNAKNRDDMSEEDFYKFRASIMQERLEGMIEAAKVKATSEDDEKYRISKAKLSCLTILRDQVRNSPDRESEFFSRMEADLSIQIEEEKKVLSDLSKKTEDSNTENLAEEDKKEEVKNPFMTRSYESFKEEAKNQGLNDYTKESYTKMKMVYEVMAISDCPDYVEIHKQLKKTGKLGTNSDISRDLLAMLRRVKFDENWKPLTEEDKKAHEWNMKYLINLKASLLGRDSLTSDEKYVVEEDPDSVLKEMVESEYERVFTDDHLLIPPDILRQELLKPRKKGKLPTSPHIESLFKDKRSVGEYLEMNFKCLSSGDTIKPFSFKKQLEEAHPEYECFQFAVAMLTNIIGDYMGNKYNISTDLGRSTKVIGGGKSKKDYIDYINMYEMQYNQFKTIMSQKKGAKKS